MEAAVVLAEKGATVVVACRDAKKAENARKEIVQRAKVEEAKVKVVALDLADLDNVKGFRARYEEVMGAATPIDQLILNAAVMALPTRQVTKQGVRPRPHPQLTHSADWD